jgi:hypothetical protein
MGKRRLLMGNTKGKRRTGSLRRRRVYNIKIDLVETGWDGVDWIGLSYDRDK